MDVWVCNFKTPKGFFLEPIYNENNWKPQVTNSNSRAVGSTIRLQLATKESVVDLQGSKGVAPKAKFKLKPQKAIRRHRGAQPTFMQVVPSNPLLEDEDEFYYIMGTTTKAMIQKHVIPDLDQGGPGENWHTQKRQHPHNPNPRVDQFGLDKGPTTVTRIDILIESPSNKRPRITPKGKKLLQPLLVSPIHSHDGIHLGELRSANEFEKVQVVCY